MGHTALAITALALSLLPDIVVLSAFVQNNTPDKGYIDDNSPGSWGEHHGRPPGIKGAGASLLGDEEGDCDNGVVVVIPSEGITDEDPFYQDDFAEKKLRLFPVSHEVEAAVSSDGGDFVEVNVAEKEEEHHKVVFPGAPRSKAVEVDASNEMAISDIDPEQEMTLGLARKICNSREFQPKLENYWISGTDEFLRDYANEHRNGLAYRDHGLVKSLARLYLGDDGFECSLASGSLDSKTCKATCEEVVQSVSGLDKARRVYFALSSAVGFAEVLGALSDSLQMVPDQVNFLVSGMPETSKWLETVNPQRRFAYEIQYYLGAVRASVFAAAPWPPVGEVAESASASLARARSNYDNAIQVAGLVDAGEDPYRWDKLFDTNYEMSISDIDFAPSGAADRVLEDHTRPTNNWHGRTVERTKQVLKDHLRLEGYLQEGLLDQARVDSYSVFQGLLNTNVDIKALESNLIQGAVSGDIVEKIRSTLSDILVGLFSGSEVALGGSTSLSTLLRYGNLLPSGTTRAIYEFKGANLVGKLSRNIFMRLFDSSFAAQKLYISCTKDAQRRADPKRGGQGPPAGTCARDNTGPQGLKACVDSQVCYLYRWSERKFDYLSRNRKPKGVDKWDEAPFYIDPQDIIRSSVQSHLQNLRQDDLNYPIDVQLSLWGGGLETLADAHTPGLFHIPVCLSQYNWNTPASGYNTLCDTDPNCAGKNFPCNCGPWGADTESVWRGIDVWGGKKHGFYARDLCPKQIQEKLENPLERYLSYCRLDVRRNNPWTRVDGLQKFQGRDKYCDAIMCTVELQGAATAAELDPEVAFACICRVKKGGSGCSMYSNMFDELWSAALTSGCLDAKKRGRLE